MYSSGFSTKLLVLSFALLFVCLSSQPIQVSYDSRALTINGERRIIISGSIHYPRSTPQMWPDLIKKAKEGGLNAIETYVFWNAHEPQRGQYDFSGRNDLVRFIRTIQNEGLYAILRIGPYVCAEWNYGGFPVWLRNLPGIEFRTDNKVFENEMANFTTLIVNMMKQNKLFAPQGGPIILAQIENEYGLPDIMPKYGEAGKKYVQWCAQFAESLNIGVPWIMCVQPNAPKPMIPTCNKFYCDGFTPQSANSVPKMWTENWTGWFKSWGSKDPHRTAEDLSFAVARFFQYKGTLQNYYMYHGGTNFGRTAGGPYLTTSYDYDAPLDEYGNYNQPKWGHLKKLHEVLKSMEKTLTYGDTSRVVYDPNGNKLVDSVVYSYKGKRVCFFGNALSTSFTINFENKNYIIPAWSVIILDDCKTEVYNTAKVNVPTTIMVKKETQLHDDEKQGYPLPLVWQWRQEHIEEIEENGSVKGSLLTSTQLLDQKLVTNDTSDYLWYLTRVHSYISEWATLRVTVSGNVIQVFVNGKYKGSQSQPDSKRYTFETKIRLHKGKNDIALCSTTVGLPNYGAFFDNTPTGVAGFEIISGTNGNVSQNLNLSTNPWIYKIGMEGETKKIYGVDVSNRFNWETFNLPTQQPFTWYKTNFKTPMGTDPVVVDLIGLGKGQAWVNGNNIGRYWPSYLADGKGCSPTCDYRGNYGDSKCRTNCGKPTQRWYHIPRSFLHDDNRDNVLVLFEEFGGSPWSAQIQTVTVGTVCGNAYEGNVLELSCQGGRIIKRIKFASFGLPYGDCGAFRKGICESSSLLVKKYVEQRCLGRERCSIGISESTLGNTGCVEASSQLGKTFLGNQLAVEAECDLDY